MTVLELISGLLQSVRCALGRRGAAASGRAAPAPAAATPFIPVAAAPAVAGFALRIEDVIVAEPVAGQDGAAVSAHDAAERMDHEASAHAAVLPVPGDGRRFMLAARLRSVEKLNRPSSRAARPKAGAPGGPCIPVDRIGARKQRAGGALGPRVLRPVAAKPSAEIIPFPGSRSGAGRKAA